MYELSDAQLMKIIEARIMTMEPRRSIVNAISASHSIERDKALELYHKTVEMIVEDELSLTEDQERALRMAQLRSDAMEANNSGDLKEKVRIRREYAETRNIMQPQRLEITVDRTDSRSQGEIIDAILLDISDDIDNHRLRSSMKKLESHDLVVVDVEED